MRSARCRRLLGAAAICATWLVLLPSLAAAAGPLPCFSVSLGCGFLGFQPFRSAPSHKCGQALLERRPTAGALASRLPLGLRAFPASSAGMIGQGSGRIAAVSMAADGGGPSSKPMIGIDMTEDASVLPRMKRAAELGELLRLCRLPLKGTEWFKDDELLEEEIDVQIVRLTGRPWLRFLQVRGIIDIGKDPARHPLALREEFLREVRMDPTVELASREQAQAASTEFLDSRSPHHVRKACFYTEKLATDLSKLFGQGEMKRIMTRLEATRFDLKVDSDSMYTEQDMRRSLGACVIIEAYMQKSVIAERLLGKDNVLSCDWQTSGMQIHEFEAVRRKMLKMLIAKLEALQGDEGAARQHKAMHDADSTLEEGQAVELEIVQKGPLGYVVRVDGEHDGLVYNNDIFETKAGLKKGQIVEGWVLKVRDDGKVDVTMRPPGAKAKISDGVEKVLSVLRKHRGTLALGDKSTPKAIYGVLGLSKKVFKESLGHLYKMHMVEMDDTHVRLLPEKEWRTHLSKPKEEVKKASARSGSSVGGKARSGSVSRGERVESAGRSGPTAKQAMAAAAAKTAAVAGGSSLRDMGSMAGAPKLDDRRVGDWTAHGNKDIVRGGKKKVVLVPGADGVMRPEGPAGGSSDGSQQDMYDAVKSREEVMARLQEDAEAAKQEAKTRLNQKREQERLRQQKRIIRERKQLDPELVEARKQILETLPSMGGGGGGGLKATMERMKAAKSGATAANGATNPNGKGAVGSQAEWEHPEVPGSTRSGIQKQPVKPINADAVAAISALSMMPKAKAAVPKDLDR